MMILFNNMDVNNMDVNKNLDVNSNCTNTMVSLLKAWKVTVVGTECNGAAF